MRKIINLLLVISGFTLLHSCQKQADLTPPADAQSAGQKNPVVMENVKPVKVSFVLSDWFSVPLAQTRNGSLYGRHEPEGPVGSVTDNEVKLAYLKTTLGSNTSTKDGYRYFQLPTAVQIASGEIADIYFNLSEKLFELMINPGQSTPVMLRPEDFKDCTWRYIVLSKADFESLSIDWSNYLEVARALGFAP